MKRITLAIATLLSVALVFGQGVTILHKTTILPKTTVFPGTSGGGGGFTPTFSTSGACNTGGFTCTVTLSVTAGQFAICGPGSTSVPTNTLSCSDTNSDSFTGNPGGSYLDTGKTIGEMFYAGLGTTNAAEVFTCTVSNDTNVAGCSVMVFNGTPSVGWDSSGASGPNGANNASTTALVSGTSGATASPVELAVGLFVVTNPGEDFTGTSGWTCPLGAQVGGGLGLGGCYKILSSTGTQQATATTGGPTDGLGMVGAIK